MPVDGVDIRDSSRSPRGLVAAARQLPGAWESGVDVRFDGCNEPEIVDRCVTADDAQLGASIVRVDPFLVRISANCTPLSNMDVEATGSSRLAATVEWAVGQAMSTGLGITQGPSLADCTPWDSPTTDVVGTFACFEQAAIQSAFGRQVWLHASPALATVLLAKDVLTTDSAGRLVTAAGSLVVVSSGYEADCVNGVATLWATTPVYLGMTEPEILSAPVDRQNNQEVWAQRYVSIAFDPCLNLCVEIPLYTPESP